MSTAPAISVVICTYNRSRELPLSLDAVLAQRGAPPYEVLVVDNNSTDDTRAVVEARLSSHPHLRYVFEGLQGLPHARNTGIREARAPIVAFTDDDIVVAPDWVASIHQAFEALPEADCIGGRVLPRWPAGGRPRWLTDRQLAPLALQDKGDAPVRVSRQNAAPCLIGANFSFRRRAFEKAGLFDPVYTRTQDREIQLRLWDVGGVGVYLPDIVTHVEVPADRLTKAYFREWYARAGRFHSRMGLLDRIDGDGRLVPPPAPDACLFGAPAYTYSQLLGAIGQCASGYLRRHPVDGFYHENRARYLASYIRERWRREGLTAATALKDLVRFARRRFGRPGALHDSHAHAGSGEATRAQGSRHGTSTVGSGNWTGRDRSGPAGALAGRRAPAESGAAAFERGVRPPDDVSVLPRGGVQHHVSDRVPS